MSLRKASLRMWLVGAEVGEEPDGLEPQAADRNAIAEMITAT
jgi:hypothetical protein